MARVFLGRRSELGPDETRIVSYPEGTPPYRSLILARRGAQLTVFWNVCCHLPVPLDSGLGSLPPDDDLVCLTHGARYRTEDGLCTAGPCKGARLERVDLEEEGDDLWALVK